jgi:hypothetical protein
LLFPSEFGAHRVRIFVDGIDVVAAAYGPGGFHGRPAAAFRPSYLLGPQGLNASQGVRVVALAGSDTTENQLTVQIRQVGSAAVWDRCRMVDLGSVVKEG